MLALALLLRCMLDPWDLVYYHLPLVVALAAWEARRGRELPVLAVARHRGLLAQFEVYDARTGMGPYVAYLAWTRPARGRPRRWRCSGPPRRAGPSLRARLAAAAA